MEEVKKRIRELIGDGIVMGYDEAGVIILRVLEEDELIFSFMSHDLVIDRKGERKDVEYEGEIKMGDTYFLFKRNQSHLKERIFYDKVFFEKMIEYNLYIINGNKEWKHQHRNYAQNLLHFIWLKLKKFVEMDYSKEIKKTLNKFRLRWLMGNETICNK